ncbi:MAG: site-specific tyrosine recombinase XerD [Flavobacteriales bacterium]|nr:MAG: site-specific tyrosine recombinase XerD [Flavobacteriales bacterium TMED96]RZP12355.1 MAG: site-specific tyrosine recombinase XerD [Flavobacteriales bacterium]|tara:strand:+ start:950 stop:1849 length:900 start_codon:yes stop_codon:yes gene_type:complete
MRTWENLLKDYLIYLKIERGLSENSIKSYSYDIKNLLSYINKYNSKLSLKQCDKQFMQEFIYEISKNINSRSQSRHLSSLKSFFNYLVFEGYNNTSPMELIESPKILTKLPDVLSIEEIKLLIKNSELNNNHGIRNSAILETLYGSGLRVSELINLKLSDIHYDDKLLLIQGKGNKQRLVPLGSICESKVSNYVNNYRILKKVKKNSNDIVFLNRNGKKLTRATIFNIVKEAQNKSNIKKTVSPHTFRHSFATHLLENGADLRSIQIMMGHENITTTEVYTHLDTKHLSKTLNKFHPRK